MKIFVDENIPSRTVSELVALGHDILDFRGTPEQGMEDELLWARIQAEGRLLVTTDKGFTQHRHERHQGILIVRLRQPNEAKIHDRVLRAIRQFEATEWPGLLVVMRDSVQSLSRSE